MDHAVEESRRHRFYDSAILGSVTSSNDYGAGRELIFPDPSFMYQAVKGLLNLQRTGIELIKKQTVSFFTRDLPWRTTNAVTIKDFGNSNDIFWS
jgi:hypothetical protein